MPLLHIRGVRQGCTLSPYLFILCIEILSASLIKDQEITGIKINGKEFKSTMFADDATFAMDGSLNFFQKLLHILDDFKLISGLKTNINKTIILRIGSLRFANIQPLENMKFLWTSESAKTLGIVFANDKHLYRKIICYQSSMISKTALNVGTIENYL